MLLFKPVLKLMWLSFRLRYVCTTIYVKPTVQLIVQLVLPYSGDRSGKIKEGEWRGIVSAEDENSALRPLPLARGSRQVKTAVEVKKSSRIIRFLEKELYLGNRIT